MKKVWISWVLIVSSDDFWFDFSTLLSSVVFTWYRIIWASHSLADFLTCIFENCFREIFLFWFLYCVSALTQCAAVHNPFEVLLLFRCLPQTCFASRPWICSLLAPLSRASCGIGWLKSQCVLLGLGQVWMCQMLLDLFFLSPFHFRI